MSDKKVSTGENGQSPEFQRFQDLARKLAAVPKKELDEVRKRQKDSGPDDADDKNRKQN